MLLQVCEQGLPEGDFSKIIAWFDYLSMELVFNKMLDQLV